MSGAGSGVSRIRLAIGAAGGALAVFGVFRLVTQVPVRSLVVLAVWLAAAVVLHDAVLSPAIVGTGLLLRKLPARARTYVQGALVAGGLVTVSAIPLILRAGTQPRAKALLDQNFGRNLVVLLGVVIVVGTTSYVLRLVRERRRSRAAGSDRTGDVEGARE